MTLHRPFRYSLLSILTMATLGCSSTSDVDYSAKATSSLTAGNAVLLSQLATTAEQNDIATEATYITDLVNIPQLDQLLDRAFINNPSLQQNILALKIAYEQKNITASDGLPTVNADFSGTATEGSDESYSANLTVAWELDLWQRVADSSSAAVKDVASSAASLQGARDLLAANIMRSWLDISLKQQLLDIENQRLSVLTNNENLILERYRSGLDNLSDLDSAKSSSASTSATVADYTEKLANSRRSLELQLGQLSQSEQYLIDIEAHFPQVIYPLDLLPEQNLERRPDLRAAFYNIEAESLRTDAAYKAMLPSISLSATLADVAESPSEALFSSSVWSLLGKLSAPLFQGGKLRSQAEVAQLKTEQSFWSYQETLLTAVNEVENAAGQEYALARQQQHVTEALESAKRSFVTYEEKYRQGLVDIFDLLTAQQKTFDLESQLSQITYNRLSNRIDLGLALGLGVSQ
ncbi:multidrug transporter [Vibrio sp. MACH09]|uniref:TolC family protein n=1 Tax=unclassified Vibrio TaxID=2614977 RepID=UPI00149376A9|nr:MULTISPECIES: TolC family protein [unclassified Vibrio]NOI67352.1 TolC family protein [Vibrio sp. 99-8-1]GLO63962.1 multidrug transporter [Vibrio sp. MACH09]